MCSQTCTSSLRQRAQHGASLLAVLAYVVIISTALAGAGLLTVSHYSRALVESGYTSALNVAEAGINYKLAQINQNITHPDTSAQNGTIEVRDGVNGAFSVSVTGEDGGAWIAGTRMIIRSTGSVDGITRIVQITAAPVGAYYTAYGLQTLNFNDPGATLDGQIGTNGDLYINGHPNITRSIILNGPSAQYGDSSTASAYATQTTKNTDIYQWPTTDTFAKQFDNSDENKLAYYNSTSGDTSKIVTGTFSGHNNDEIILPSRDDGQPANYHISALDLQDNSHINFDNSKGPINVWINIQDTSGDASGADGVVFRGGIAKKLISEAPDKPVRIFVMKAAPLVLQATKNTSNIAYPEGAARPWNDPSNPVSLGIYDYNINKVTTKKGTKDVPVGSVTLQGPMDFRGQVIADDLLLNAGASTTSHLNFKGRRGYFEPSQSYGFAGGWRELNRNGNIGGATQ